MGNVPEFGTNQLLGDRKRTSITFDLFTDIHNAFLGLGRQRASLLSSTFGIWNVKTFLNFFQNE